MATPIITLTDARISTARACEIHEGWPLHPENECDRLAGIQPYTRDVRCSVCGLRWGDVAVSQHESCADLMSDGSRRYARPVVTYTRAGEDVEIVTDDGLG